MKKILLALKFKVANSLEYTVLTTIDEKLYRKIVEEVKNLINT